MDLVDITEQGHAQNHHLHMVENSVLVALTKLMLVPLALNVQVGQDNVSHSVSLGLFLIL